MSDKFKSCPFCGEPDEHDNFQFDDEPNGHGICVYRWFLRQGNCSQDFLGGVNENRNQAMG